MKPLARHIRLHWRTLAPAAGGLILLTTGLVFAYRAYTALQAENHRILNVANREKGTLEHNIEELSQKLAAAEQLNSDLQLLLQARTQETYLYTTRVQELAASVLELEKLSKTDRELLQKYSSVYFLNENYVPESLSQLGQSYLLRENRDEYVHTRIKPRLERMISDARAAGHDLAIVSAYRSFGVQADLKAQYKLQYGSGTANTFSAEQGFSEHQLGSTVDLSTPDVGGPYLAFDKTNAFTWLEENAHRYGFTLSYPKNNPYFEYEPWHWRYVGVELATKLHNEGTYFYNLDQRDINLYLAKIFD